MSRSASSSFTPRDAGLLILLSLLWGNSFLFIKTAVEEIPPGWIVAGRMTIGGALLVGIVLSRQISLPRRRRVLVALATIGVAGTAAGWFGQAWAQQFLDSGLVAVLNATTPGATLLLAVAFGIERLHAMRVTGLLVAVVGSVIIIGGEVSAGGPVLALAIAAIAPFAYGLGSVITRKEISGRVDTLPAVAVQLTLGAAVASVFSVAVEGPPPLPTDIPLVPAAALLALGLLGTGVAFIIYFTLIGRVGATNASMVTYLVPVVGLIAGAIFRGERFGPNVFLGAATLIVGVYLAQRRPVPGQGALTPPSVPDQSIAEQATTKP
ncbi:DMT family transporter [Euzebya tangerina]|uniref:DMT family transporter n=1 Tax=Euzebya tangerina TaxID=591198 RepID=UPI000E31CADD|nr:DMT family transporter [Euzebya tangerina]